MDSKIRIKDWNKFQHFKDRKPIWIKLYRDIMDDVEWHELSGDSAKTLVMLWLLASEDDGYLPDIKTISFRLRLSQTAAKASLKDLSHWLDINTISDLYQDDSLETEKRREENTSQSDYGVQFEGIWKLYLRKGTKKSAYAQWQKLSEPERDAAVEALNPYFQEEPRPKYRKDFERYLSGKMWEGILERKEAGQLNIPEQQDLLDGLTPKQRAEFAALDRELGI